MKRKQVDLKVGLSGGAARGNRRAESPEVSSSSEEVSGRSSCVSMEVSSEDEHQLVNSSPRAAEAEAEAEAEATSMVLVGCPRCLMYVMLSDVDRKCPKCKSTVLLHFLNEQQQHIITKPPAN